jgi:hypothetical protein
MRRYYTIISSGILCFFLILSSQNIQSQSSNQITLNQPDTSASDGSPHSLFTGLGYGSNMVYLGSTISQDQPFGYSALTYGYRDALYATVSAVHLAERSPFLAFCSGSLSFNHTFNSWFDISASFSGYKAAPSLADTLFNKFLYGDLTLGFDWRLIYTKITGGILYSDEINGYFQIRNSRYFETPEFTKNKVTLSFDPNFSILFGPLTKVETSDGRIITISPPYRKGGKWGNSTPVSIISTSFGLIELDFGLPVSFNASRFAIEAEPAYILPVYDDPEYPGLKGFVFLLSGYFRIM